MTLDSDHYAVESVRNCTATLDDISTVLDVLAGSLDGIPGLENHARIVRIALEQNKLVSTSTGRLLNVIADMEPSATTHDIMAVWEYYVDNDASEALEKLPTRDHGMCECREYVAATVTPFCDKWFSYAAEFLGYDDSYDWEFLPVFLGNLPHHDIERLTLKQIGKALRKLMKVYRATRYS